jgi:hypothetical protein
LAAQTKVVLRVAEPRSYDHKEMANPKEEKGYRRALAAA